MTRKRFQKLARAKYTQMYLEWLKDPTYSIKRTKVDFQYCLKFLRRFKAKSPKTYQQTFDWLFT